MEEQGRLEATDSGWRFSFTCFGGPCEVTLDHAPRRLAQELGEEARCEALRIQSKFSRYAPSSELSRINRGAGKACEVDAETAGLLDLADTAHHLSEGAFDISAGVLGQLWDFRRSGEQVEGSEERRRSLLARVGWSRVDWRRPRLNLPARMELDLGGLGKEYAVDRCLALLATNHRGALLVNFGGDLAVHGTREGDQPWRVAVEEVDAGQPERMLHLREGALATSGDNRRFVYWHGKRVAHILDARTGLPPDKAPRSVTVAAPTCCEAGLLATLALLRGAAAGTFLEEQGRPHWIRNADE